MQISGARDDFHRLGGALAAPIPVPGSPLRTWAITKYRTMLKARGLRPITFNTGT